MVEKGFFRLLDIVENDLLLKVDQEVSEFDNTIRRGLSMRFVNGLLACSNFSKTKIFHRLKLLEEGVFAKQYFDLEKSAFQDLAFTYARGAMQGEGILKIERESARFIQAGCGCA